MVEVVPSAVFNDKVEHRTAAIRPSAQVEGYTARRAFDETVRVRNGRS